MLAYYFRTALRYLWKDRLYTFINLAGLSIGLGCCLIIFLYVFNEFSYDRFHKNSNSIYRLTMEEKSEGNLRSYAHSYIPTTPLLKTNVPGINHITRFLPYSTSVANKARNLVYQEDGFCFADSNFLELFSFKLKSGDREYALEHPGNILISQGIAQKYFGDEDPVGQELVVNTSLVYKVAGVLENIPSTSSLQFDILAPLASTRFVLGDWVARSWYHPPVYTFLQINDSDLASVNTALKSFGKFLPEKLGDVRTHMLQPLKEVHFSGLENEMAVSNNKKTLYVFTAIAILILIIAVANFINLFLSRLLRRLRSMGIRKVVGAGNNHLWWQTSSETLLYMAISLLVAVALAKATLPLFNSALGIQLDLFKTDKWTWISLASIVLLTNLAIASVPISFFSRLSIFRILKSENTALQSRKKVFSLRSFFVIFQFAIAIALIVSTLTIRSQLQFVQDKNLGLKRQQTLVVPISDEKFQDNFLTVKSELERIAGVNHVSAISNFPWTKGFYDFNTTLNDRGRTVESNAFTLLVEDDFISTMGMTMVAGRAFSRDYRTDSSNAFIINETAAKKFGIDAYPGVKLVMQDVASGKPKEGELIGIVKDFHLESLHKPVQPLILTISPAGYYLDNMVLNITASSVSSTIKQVENFFKQNSPDRPFDFYFLDEAFDKLYKKETRQVRLFNYFSILAILIACLGLFGISAVSAVQRTREIGIRKVFGASISGLVGLLSGGLLKLVLIAALIAFSVAWWLMNLWLENFAYRVNVQWWIFLVAGVFAMGIAFFTVSIHAIKAAMANPVKSLRRE